MHKVAPGLIPKSDPPSAAKRLRQFLLHDLWRIEISSLSGIRALAVRLLRVGHLVIKGFRQDELPLHAAALTFSTLMALVPFLAIALSMSRGLGAGDEMILKLTEFADAMPEQFQAFVNDIVVQVSSTNFIAVSGVSGLILLTMVIQMLGSMEASFNKVWGIRNARNLLRRSAYYISTIVVVPILIVASGTLAAGFEPLIERLGGAAAYALLLKLSPLVLTWLAFAFLYAFIPNTHVRARPALVSSFIGALLWLGWLRFYVTVQPGVGNYNVIYGALASVPIFLAWLYVSWVIVLLGVQLCFAIQNDVTYHMERVAPRASAKAKLLLALSIAARAGEALEGHRQIFDAGEFAKARGVSIRLVNELLRVLTRAGLLAEVREGDDCFVLMRSPDRVRVKDVMDLILDDGSQPDELGLDHLRDEIKEVLSAMDRGVQGAVEKVTLRDLMIESA